MRTQTDFRIPVGQRVPAKIIRQVVQLIAQNFNPDKIILFGSYAYGIPEPFSDVDLLVIMERDQDEWQQIQQIRAMLPPRSFGLDILVRSQSEIEQRIALDDHFIKTIVAQGKVVYERNHERVDI